MKMVDKLQIGKPFHRKQYTSSNIYQKLPNIIIFDQVVPFLKIENAYGFTMLIMVKIGSQCKFSNRNIIE